MLDADRAWKRNMKSISHILLNNESMKPLIHWRENYTCWKAKL